MNPDRYENLVVDDFSGGLKENSPAGKNPPTHFLRFKNARVMTDKVSVKKRPGLSQFDSSYSFGSNPVLGCYGIYEDEAVKSLVCLPSALYLKAGGTWSSIFSPTESADLPVSVCQYLGVTFVGGYEDLIAILNGEAGYAGLEAPASTPTLTETAVTGTTKILENPTSNLDHAAELRAINGNTILAMSFKPTEDVILTKVVLPLRKVGSPTGNLWVEIHSAQGGTSGSKNSSTNIVGQASDDLDVSTLTGSYADKDLDFSGTAPELTGGQTYYIVIYGSFTVSTTNYVEVGADFSLASYVDGIYWEIDNTLAWTSRIGVDICFEIWGAGGSEGEQAGFGAVSTGYSTPVRSTAAYTLAAQKFTVNPGAVVSSVQLALRKIIVGGLPSGVAFVEIHSSQSGTSLTKNASTNIVGQASDEVDLDDIHFNNEFVEFTFSGTAPTLTAETDYYIVLYITSAISTTRFFQWTKQEYATLNGAYSINGSLAWTNITDQVHSFKLFGTTTEQNVLEYDTANVDEVLQLRQDNAVCILAQAFELATDETIETVKLYLAKVGSPTGNLWAEIHASQGGTSATKDASTNIVGAASDNQDVSAIAAFPTYTQYELTFATPAELVSGRTYYLMIYCSSTVSSSAYVKVARSFFEQPIGSSIWQISNTLAWVEKNWMEVIFEFYATITGIPGTRKYVVTYYRGGNYPVESNPSPESLATVIASGNYVALTNIPVSSDSRVTARKLYRTEDEGETFYYLATIEDNTTTTFTDIFEDDDINQNDEVEYDNDRPPAGDSIESWDGRLWISDGGEYVYMSKAGMPEQFDLTGALALREKESSQIIRLKEFQNNLTAFKRSSIWCVQRDGDTRYIVDKVVADTGLGARASVVEAAGGLIFLSNNKQIEIFDGKQILTPRISDAVCETLKSINTAFMYRASAEHYVPENEYRLAVPTGNNEWPDTVIIFNYARGTFALDTHENRKISSICVTDVAVNTRAMVYGSSAGELMTVDEEATDDAGIPIIMDVQTSWYGEQRFRNLRRLYIHYALDESLEAELTVYSNFDGEIRYSQTLTGNTPAGDDPTLRDTIQKALKMNVQGSFFSFRIVQSTGPERCILSKLNMIFRRRLPRGDIQAT